MKRLTEKNIDEAERDWNLLHNPGYGGFNLCYNDNYFAMNMQTKWQGWHTLGERIKKMRADMRLKAESTAGAGI